jgi:hypothetical protein
MIDARIIARGERQASPRPLLFAQPGMRALDHVMGLRRTGSTASARPDESSERRNSDRLADELGASAD